MKLCFGLEVLVLVCLVKSLPRVFQGPRDV